MKNKKRFNKTYKNRPTKYQRQQRTTAKQKTLSALLASLFILSLYSAIATTRHANTDKQQNATIATLTEKVYQIELKTKNTQAEVIINESALQACHKHALDKTPEQLDACRSDLVAMAYTETQEDPFNCELKGNDSYNSLGCFQISRHYHPEITDAQAIDPFFSADWTLARMINNGYKTNRDNAVRLHNGSITLADGSDNWRTAQYLSKVNHYKNLLIN